MGTRGIDVGEDNRRTNGRIAVGSVRTSVGVILDASAGGLRIRGGVPKGSKPGSIMTVTIEDDEGRQSISLESEIRWIQRHPFRGATFGVSFLEIGEEERALLFSIIRSSKLETRCRWNAPAA